MNTGQLKEQIAALEIAVHLVSEALDLPEMAMASTSTYESVTCSGCGAKTRKMNKKPGTEEVRSFVQRLLGTYMDNKAQVDEFIANAKSKWKVERMVSIDRDILRLACTEAFFMDDIPINVAVSEAVELCHRFADERAAKFINGILGDMTEEAAAFRASSVSTVLQ